MIAAMLIFSYLGMFFLAILVKSLVNFKSVPKQILPLENGKMFYSNIANKQFTKDYSAIGNVQLLVYCFQEIILCIIKSHMCIRVHCNAYI